MQITLEVLFKVFFIAIVIDFVIGVLVAAKRGGLKSRTCSDGMFRLIGECIVLGIFISVDYLVPSLNSILVTFIAGFIFKEDLSIVENLVYLDVWTPNSIKKTLQVEKDKINHTAPKGIRYKITKVSKNGKWGYAPYRKGWLSLNKKYVFVEK